MRIFFKNDGAVTVFLSLILVPMLIIAGVSVDAIRIYGAKAIVQDSMELTMNTALASYNQVLKDVYGLLAYSKDENELSNNLVKYFENTINSVGLELDEEDSYTKAIIEDIKNMINSPDELNFTNLINMTTVDFSAKNVEGTELYNPEVVKRQIVEYMKYRGVVSIGDNFFDKLSVFKEVDKQQEVIESKVDYEASLSEIESSCMDVYKAIKSYEELVNKLGNFKVKNFIENSKEGCESYKGLKDINRLLVTVYTNEGINDDLSRFRVDTSSLSYLDLKGYLESCGIAVLINNIGTLEGDTDDVIKYFFNINENASEIKKMIKYYEDSDEKFEEYKSYLIEIFREEQEDAKEEAKKNNQTYVPQRNTALEEAIDEYKQLVGSLSPKISILNNYCKDLSEKDKYMENIIDSEFEKLNTDLNEKYIIVEATKHQLIIAVDSLNYLKDSVIPDIKAKNEILKSKIDSLSEGSIKDSLSMQYKEMVEFFNDDEIDKLLDILKFNKNYYESFLYDLNQIEYINYKVVKEKLNVTAKKLSKVVPSINKSNYELAIDNADNIFLSNFKCNSENNSDSVIKKDYADIPIYIYIKRNCSGLLNEENNESNKKVREAAKKENKGLLDTVSKEVSNYESNVQNKESNTNYIPVDGEIYEDLATTLLQNNYKDINDGECEISSSGSVKESKKIAKNQAEFMKNSTKLIDGIKNFAGSAIEGSRDNLFLSEYMTEMFSCYTTNCNNTLEKTLSGFEINENNNYLFGSEMEYILWGQNGDKTSKNLSYTSYAIFGLRFVLNTIYAYTDSEIESWTTSLAIALSGWTGFGVPIVKNVLMLVLAMGESALDLTKLLAGEAVVVYKTYTTWVLKPSHITTEGISYTLKTVTEEALNEVSNSIIKLTENVTDENVDKLEVSFDEYAQSLADDLAISISNMILTPIEVQLNTWIETNGKDGVEKFEDMLDEMYDELRKSIQKDEDCFAKDIKLMMLDMFIKNNLENLKVEIMNTLTSFSGDIASLKSKIVDTIKSYMAKLTDETRTAIFNNGYENLKNEAKESFKGITNNVKENANKAIDDFVNKVSSSYTFSPNNINASDTSSISPNITMNYKEYIKVFLFSGMLAGKDNTFVSRMCDLIKLNLASSNNAPMPEFKLANSYTMLKLDTRVNVNTTFLPSDFISIINYSCINGY